MLCSRCWVVLCYPVVNANLPRMSRVSVCLCREGGAMDVVDVVELSCETHSTLSTPELIQGTYRRGTSNGWNGGENAMAPCHELLDFEQKIG